MTPTPNGMTSADRLKAKAQAAGSARMDPSSGYLPDDIEFMAIPAPPPWPTLRPEAYHGLLGEIVRAIEPETEADPVAILGQLLVAFGSSVGRRPYFTVEGGRHYPNLFMTIVGKSAHGRKGTSWGRVAQVMSLVDPHWVDNCVSSGLSSGEGLLKAVRDPVTKKGPDGEPVVIDEGVIDKRLCLVEGEFAQVLRCMQREGNTLSARVRNLWDMGKMSSLTVERLKVTDAHVSVIGHITRDELIGYLAHAEMFNGFANRFIWLLARRSKQLPDGGQSLDLTGFQYVLQCTLDAARTVSVVRRSDAAARLWRAEYGRLTADHDGLFGHTVSRADAQTLRLSMLYALFDGHSIIDEQHLRAALALWDYAEETARIVFGEESPNPLVDKLVEKLQAAGPKGMTRTEIHAAFGNNQTAEKILGVLATLRDGGKARSEKVKTGKPGPPTERWFAVP